MGYSGDFAPRYHPDHKNPMATSSKEKYESPLKKYEHLLSPSSNSINSLDQHLFLVNISTLFSHEPAQALRLTIARTADRSLSPYTGESATRNLFYAALVVIAPPSSPEGDAQIAHPPRTLLRGAAVPHFTAPPELLKSGTNTSSKMSFSSAAHRHPDEERELRDAKEKAIKLLIEKVEGMVHAEFVGEGQVEVWEDRGWKFSESAGIEARDARVGKEGREGSVKGGRMGEKGWFSKG